MSRHFQAPGGSSAMSCLCRLAASTRCHDDAIVSSIGVVSASDTVTPHIMSCHVVCGENSGYTFGDDAGRTSESHAHRCSPVALSSAEVRLTARIYDRELPHSLSSPLLTQHVTLNPELCASNASVDDRATAPLSSPSPQSFIQPSQCVSSSSHVTARPAASPHSSLSSSALPCDHLTISSCHETIATAHPGHHLSPCRRSSCDSEQQCTASSSLSSPQLESTISQILQPSSVPYARLFCENNALVSLDLSASSSTAEAVDSTENDVSQSSNASDEILYTQNLTLDKAMIARDLFGEDSEDCCCIAGVSIETGPDVLTSRPDLPSVESTVDAAIVSSSEYPARLRSTDVRQTSPAQLVSRSMIDETDAARPCAVSLGERHQADIPDLLTQRPSTTASSCCMNRANAEDRCQLVWSGSSLCESAVVEYLRCSPLKPTSSYERAMPAGGQSQHHRCPDNEQALTLLHKSCYSLNLTSSGNTTGQCATAALSVTDRCFTQHDENSFEAGLTLFGKNFSRIRRFKLPDRSVGELVRFYYGWKRRRSHRYLQILPKHEKRKQLLRYSSSDALTEKNVSPSSSGITTSSVSSSGITTSSVSSSGITTSPSRHTLPTILADWSEQWCCDTDLLSNLHVLLSSSSSSSSSSSQPAFSASLSCDVITTSNTEG